MDKQPIGRLHLVSEHETRITTYYTRYETLEIIKHLPMVTGLNKQEHTLYVIMYNKIQEQIQKFFENKCK